MKIIDLERESMNARGRGKHECTDGFKSYGSCCIYEPLFSGETRQLGSWCEG